MKTFRRPLIAVAICATASFQMAAAQTYSRTDTITYADNLSLWVIGQPGSSTNVETAKVESQTDYDPATALPIRTYAFGKLQQTLTYDLASAITTGQRGTLKTISDGRDTGTYNTTITLSVWKRGIPQTISFPDGTTKSAVVDDLGQIASVTDETGAKTCYAYDPMGRLQRITYPSESQAGVCADYHATNNPNGSNPTLLSFTPVATAEYGVAAGHWKQTVTTGNGTKVSYLDALWRPLVVDSYDTGNVAATRSVNVTRYDADGRTVYQGYPVASLTDYATSNQGTRTQYDALGRPTRVEQDSELGVLATTTAYISGFRTQVTNPRGNVTTTGYKTYDQPSTDWPVAIVHPEGAYTDIDRDTFGKPNSLTRRNTTSSVWQRRSYTYNDYQELCRTDEAETGSSFMGYDAAGNLAWSASGYTTGISGCTDAASVAARRADRTYDSRNRVSTLAFYDGKGNTTYTYTDDGLQETASVDNGDGNVVTTTYGYNKRRLLTSELMSWNAIAWTLGYGYNANGHLASQVYPGNLTINYAPNALGQPTQAGTYATGVQYYPNGVIRQFTYGNGIVHTMTQNARQLPDVSRDAYGTIETLDDGYDYDQNGNVVAISDGATVDGHGNRSMTYDGLDRLLSATSTGMFGGTISYTYDVLDNIQTLVGPGRNLRYCYQTSPTATWRLTFVRSGSTNCSDGAATMALNYDVQGNLATKNNTNYWFDLGNRLRWTSGGVASSYVYDAAGRRVRDYTTASKYSLYAQAGQLGFTSDARANEQQWYVYLGGSLVAIREQNLASGTIAVRYQHTDALGTPVAVTDASRNVIERSEYEPYGKVLNRPVHDGPGYTGHVEDAATGLTYMQQRYYDPAIGRFLSVDPVTADGATGANFNRYWYANNNPYRFTDPDGRKGRVVAPSIDPKTLTEKEQQLINEASDAEARYGDIAAKSNDPSMKSEYENSTIEYRREPSAEAIAKNGGNPITSQAYRDPSDSTKIILLPAAMSLLNGNLQFPDYHGMPLGVGGIAALNKVVFHEHGHGIDTSTSGQTQREINASAHANSVYKLLPRVLKESWKK